jgi:hypothetical protein
MGKQAQRPGSVGSFRRYQLETGVVRVHDGDGGVKHVLVERLDLSDRADTVGSLITHVPSTLSRRANCRGNVRSIGKGFARLPKKLNLLAKSFVFGSSMSADCSEGQATTVRAPEASAASAQRVRSTRRGPRALAPSCTSR